MSSEGFFDHPQQESALFRLPSELQRQIFAYVVPARVHIHLHQDGICVSTCITHEHQKGDYYCFDRRSTGDPTTEVWARRLCSSWGAHWRCEEVALSLHSDVVHLKSEHDSARALMSSCRRIYQHVASLIAESSVIHIADIATLGFLLDAMDPPSNASSSLCPNRLFSNAFSSIKSLDLSFRLPRQVYTAIEAQSTQPNSTCTPNQKPSPATTWISMWTDLAHLKHLQALKITLDHDSESSWSAINEQAILRSIHPLTTSPNPELHVTVHMPQVPKTHADPPAHNLPSSFSISRFTRQRFFTERRQDDSVGIVYEEDAYKSFQIPGENVTETVRAAELTMHIWFLGIDLDYLAVEEPSDGESEPELLAS